MQGFSSDFEQFFLVKNNLCIFKNKYGSQIGNAMKKYTLFWLSLSIERSSLGIFFSQNLMQVINYMGQHSIYRVNYLSLNRLQNLHFVNADATDGTDNADDVDNANDYNRAIGIARLKAFRYAKKLAKSVFNVNTVCKSQMLDSCLQERHKTIVAIYIVTTIRARWCHVQALSYVKLK